MRYLATFPLFCCRAHMSGPHLLFDCKGCYGEGCHKLNPSKHLLSSYLQNLFFSAQAGQALFASDISMLAVPSLEVLDLTVSGNKLPYFQVKLLLDLHTSDLLACSPWGPLTNTVIIERWQKVASQWHWPALFLLSLAIWSHEFTYVQFISVVSNFTLLIREHLSLSSFVTLHKDLGTPGIHHASSDGIDVLFSHAADALSHLEAVPQFP